MNKGLQHQTISQPSTNATTEGVNNAMTPTNIQGSTTGTNSVI